ncbi:hypothetical protein BU24DRAFT_152751 [Aaosphaeria arxii CBS 175.79]|uniref:Uncharacterized protein n=1 Tax=Aaosphaeria arxii CBS 175.79 TaxID=1450172 RepID=A0A6A5XXL5_9PLEO|nr:uncharacterized protein BU24DRAFT_152751 [Aaosphaeria arxii CBS 175.79]KAF2017567.1 hypothetical protein BU24DRAFT_152751 [Aaosphaeria arxii CBS 175.79]
MLPEKNFLSPIALFAVPFATLVPREALSGPITRFDVTFLVLSIPTCPTIAVYYGMSRSAQFIITMCSLCFGTMDISIISFVIFFCKYISIRGVYYFE